MSTPLDTFLSEIMRSEIDEVIVNSLNNIGYSCDYSILTFPEELESEDAPIPNGYVEIRDLKSKMFITKQQLLDVLIKKKEEFSKRLND